MKVRVGFTIFEADTWEISPHGDLIVMGTTNKVSPADVMFRHGKRSDVTAPFPSGTTDTLETIFAESHPVGDRLMVSFQFANGKWLFDQANLAALGSKNLSARINSRKEISERHSEKPILTASKRKFFGD
jgi:hypothetical protein